MYCKHCGRYMEHNDGGDEYCRRCRSLMARYSKKEMKHLEKDEKKKKAYYHRLNESDAHTVGNITINERDNPSVFLNFIGFLLPVLGLIIYLIICNRSPVRAKSLWRLTVLGLILDLFAAVILLMLLFPNSYSWLFDIF